MVDAVGDLIEAGRVKVYAVDSYDSGSWYRDDLPLEERARLHGLYEDWIVNQVVPFIRDDSGRQHEIAVTGVSFGAYHAANFALRHADLFPLAICQSGVYDVSVVGGGERGDAVYFNNPADYVAHLGGDHLDWLRGQVNLLLVAGQGQWEDTTGALESTRRFAGAARREGDPTRARRLGPRRPARLARVARADRASSAPLRLSDATTPDRAPARHRGGLAARLRAPALAASGRSSTAARRTSSRASGSRTSRSTSATGRATRS